ncbi:MAG: pseudaminic acid cytidylyltransferase [Candidatus Cloacimonetes bacterium]|nr:pseudaminic acid cytidylyltransferase [Candidatus Cloacimonadota bacterium]
MNTVAIIPARGGSKRIPRKNIKNFLGKPIIAYSIEYAQKSKLFDEIMVSTDDKEIAKVAKNYGASVPFMRSKENSDDYSGTADVLVEVLQEYKNRNINFDYCCCIYPAAPTIEVKNIINVFNLLKEKKYDSFFPVVRYRHPIQRSYKIIDGKLIMNKKENLSERTQDLLQYFHDAGQFYWMKVDKFFDSKEILTNNTGTIELSELEVQDIDNEDDWKIAEIKYEYIRKRCKNEKKK